MGRRLTLWVEAEVDINEAVGWYETQRAGLGIQFIWNLNVLLERIQEHPLHFPIVDQEVRREMLNRFPYGVFFTVDDEEVLVLAVSKRRSIIPSTRATRGPGGSLRPSVVRAGCCITALTSRSARTASQ